MVNNLGLFVTHYVFLTDDQIASVVAGEGLSCMGHCVPVWVDAKTGRTTEPAKEVFCFYEIRRHESPKPDVRLQEGRGYSIWIPEKSEWSPPAEVNFDEISSWTKEQREGFLSERDKWWFNNPRPMDLSDLARGYMRFEIKVTDLKIGRRKYSAQHMVEIASLAKLHESLCL